MERRPPDLHSTTSPKLLDELHPGWPDANAEPLETGRPLGPRSGWVSQREPRVPRVQAIQVHTANVA